MSVEALWTVEYELAPHGWTNGGIVVLESERVFGGDSQYYYVGTYVLKDRHFSADIHATHYHGEMWTAFCTDEDTLHLSAHCEWDGDKVIQGTMSSETSPVITLGIKMTKQTDLP